MDLFEITFLFNDCQKEKGNLNEGKEYIRIRITQGGMKGKKK